MAQIVWCWRCRESVPMLEPHEWSVIEEARLARRDFPVVLDNARASLPAGHSYTMLAADEPVVLWRLAYVRLGYELFTGVRSRNLAAILHHRTALYGPPCSACGKPLRTPTARLCAACGGRRIGAEPAEPCHSSQTRLHRPNLRKMSIGDVLAGGPALLLADEARAGRRPFPDDEEDWLILTLERPELGLVALSEPRPPLAKRIFELGRFREAVLGDQLRQYFDTWLGDTLPDVLEHCQAIGATRAASLVRALLSLYPRQLDRNATDRATYLAQHGDDSGDAARKLAIEHWDAFPELSARLETFVATHLTDFEQTLEQTRRELRQRVAARSRVE